MSERKLVSAVQVDAVRRIYELGCPVDRDENGYEYCYYCVGQHRGHFEQDADGVTQWREEEEIDHADDCPWLPFAEAMQ